MLKVDNNMAEKLNANSRRLAKGVTSFPFEVPQFYRDGGEVDLFKQNTYPQQQNLAQRLPTAGSNAATQSKDLRFNMDKQGKSYMPKPDPYRVNLGANPGVSLPPAIKPLGPTLVDSNMVANVAANAANQYRGPYQDKVKEMFPPPRYKDGGMVDPERSKKDAKMVDPTKPEGYGLIEGPGSGKSDDIDATLNQQDYILPVETVEMIGRPVLDSLVARIMGDEQMEGEGQPEVEAKVSNQEYRVPYPVVEELGVEFFDRLKQMSGVPDLSKRVDGKQAYDSGSTGGVKDEENKKQIYDPGVAGLPDLQKVGQPIVDAAKSVNQFFNTSDSTLARGDQRPPGYQQQTNVVQPSQNKSLGNLALNAADSFKVGFNDLFRSNQQNNLSQFPVKTDTTKTDLFKSGIDNGQQQSQPSQEVVKNILGQPVQTPDKFFGGYKVYGDKGATAIEIPWNQRDESAQRRFLPADQYNELQNRAADYQAQRNAAVIPYSEEGSDNKYGSAYSRSQGGFSPNSAGGLSQRGGLSDSEAAQISFDEEGRIKEMTGKNLQDLYDRKQAELDRADYFKSIQILADKRNPEINDEQRAYAQFVVNDYKKKMGIE